MHGYADANHANLPPAALHGKEGQPLLSWRVLLLPHLEQQALYEKFRLNEPWDSPHNAALLKEMPSIYTRPGVTAREDGYGTIYQVFIGPGTAFEQPLGWNLGLLCSHGNISELFLVVEAAEPVPWTKPQDMPYAADQPLPALGGLFKNRGFRPFSREFSQTMFQAAFVDGHVEPLPLPEQDDSRVRRHVTYK